MDKENRKGSLVVSQKQLNEDQNIKVMPESYKNKQKIKKHVETSLQLEDSKYSIMTLEKDTRTHWLVKHEFICQ